MIHSLAGGSIKDIAYNDFAKVQLTSGENAGKWFWYISEIKDLAVGDRVVVPISLQNTRQTGVVLQIVRQVSAYNSPVPTKRAKKIISKVAQQI